LWIIAASFGRLATVRALLIYFRAAGARNLAEETVDDTAQLESEKTESHIVGKNHPVRALIDLNFLRVALLLATLLALAGAAILSSFVSTKAIPRPDLTAILFMLFAVVIVMTAWFLNWWLSFSTILAVREGQDALAALSAVTNLVWERPGSIFAVSAWTGLAHLTALSIGSTTLGFSMAFLQIVPPRLVIASAAVITLLYFAVADWLCIARIAGYICIAENPAALFAKPLPTSITPGGNAMSYQTSIDREEPILSDLPNLALET
jgi:hypothetical protein